MSLSLHQIKVFIAVAEYKSVSKAAQYLHMSQPAVSNIMKILQAEYNCQLIEIVGRQLYLTVFGERFLEYCHKIQQLVEQSHFDMNLLKGDVHGTIKLACVSTAKYFIPELLSSFRLKYPNVHIKLTVCSRQQIITRLEENEDDIAITSHPPKYVSLHTLKIHKDYLIIASSHKSTINYSKQYTLADLKDEVWITREQCSGTRLMTNEIFKKNNFNPKYVMEVTDCEGVKQAIISDVGISAVSLHCVQLEQKLNLIKQLDVDGFPFEYSWYAVSCQGKKMSPITENLIQFMKNSASYHEEHAL